MRAAPAKADPLTADEKRIIARIGKKFPRDQMVYNAAHRETIWKRKARGAIIPYTESGELKAL